MKPLTIANPAPLIDPAVVQAALKQNVSSSQMGVAIGQVNPIRAPRPVHPRMWGLYSKLTLGRTLSGPPHVLWCGYFSPATQPSILFAEVPHAPPACSPGNPNINTLNNAKYWTRRVDLPINR